MVAPTRKLSVQLEASVSISYKAITINFQDVRVNYRGMPPSHQENNFSPDDVISEKQILHKVGLVSTEKSGGSPTLAPGSGSWMFNSIESRARHGLTPTHVPAVHHDQVMSETSDLEETTDSDQETVTIPAMYKDILAQSSDYQTWLTMKNNFLKQHVSNNPGDRDDKFPNFPGDSDTDSYNVDEDDPRNQREISGHGHTSPPVFKEGGTLYRARTPLPRRLKTKSGEEKRRRPAPVQVSSLPVTSPAPTYSSPLYPGSHYSTPQPPLPPGYELIPVDQLTDEHEVVPWEDLPTLMRQHNMSLNTIPLGPYHHSTTTQPPPVKIFSSAPRVPFSTPAPQYKSTTKKPFTVFSPISDPLPASPVPPYIPPPVSPELSDSLFYGQVTPKHHHHHTPDTPSKPKSIHFGTHFGPLKQESSTVRSEDVVSNTFRYNPTTVPAYDHTPSLGSSPTPAPGHTSAPTLPTLGRYSPFPGHYTTASTPHFESTKLPSPGLHHHHPQSNFISSTSKYLEKYSASPKYYPTSTLQSVHHFPTTTPTTIHHYPTTTAQSIYHQPTSTPSPVKYFTATSSPATKSPPSMPQYLPIPNVPHPTYFDVARPVEPVPHQVSPVESVTFKPTVPAPVSSSPIILSTSATPVVLQGKLKTTGDQTASVRVVLPSDNPKIFEHFTTKSEKNEELRVSTDTPDDTVTKHNNPNKMRSSTSKSQDLRVR